MVRGIEKFKEHFKGFEGKYTLIGGVACGLLLDDAGLEFRGTQDFDIVLIVEAMDSLFGHAVWDFIKSGEYEIREKEYKCKKSTIILDCFKEHRYSFLWGMLIGNSHIS